MSHTTDDLRKEIDKSLELIRGLRDEIRVQLHLAGMDAKDEWQKLEPQISDMERTAHHVTEATRIALAETVKRLSALRSKLS